MQKRSAEAEAALRHALTLIDPNGEGQESQELATALGDNWPGLNWEASDSSHHEAVKPAGIRLTSSR
ncbi:MAG: hypothetical protein IPK16_01540 [Anaerolineales bacterium]|nr:hypothetical protein [Anaerolineales bacterium]